MISLYTTIFNLDNFSFSIEETLSNWFCYVDEVVITTLNKQEDELKRNILSGRFHENTKVFSMDIDPEKDIYWDGILKNNSLQNCSNEVVIQLDFDERISGNKTQLVELIEEVDRHDFPCCIMIPTVDLYEDLDSYVNIGYKWYLHKKQGSFRGSVGFAIKNNGSFDPEKSDTCELIDKNSNLIPCIGKLPMTQNGIKIIHLGYLDLEAKNKINKNFWGEIWDFRKTGVKKENFVCEKIESGDPRKKPHKLTQPLWPTV